MFAGRLNTSPRAADLAAVRYRSGTLATAQIREIPGRPTTEDLLAGITRSDVDAVRRALLELGSARLLADSTPEGAYRLSHALLAEAVAAGLLPGERVALHKRTAQALSAPDRVPHHPAPTLGVSCMPAPNRSWHLSRPKEPVPLSRVPAGPRRGQEECA